MEQLIPFYKKKAGMNQARNKLYSKIVPSNAEVSSNEIIHSNSSGATPRGKHQPRHRQSASNERFIENNSAKHNAVKKPVLNSVNEMRNDQSSLISQMVKDEVQVDRKVDELRRASKSDLENQEAHRYIESRTIADSKSSEIRRFPEKKLYKQSRYSKDSAKDPAQTLKLLSGIINELLTENLSEERTIPRNSYEKYLKQKTKYTSSNSIFNDESRIFTDEESRCKYLSKSKKSRRKCLKKASRLLTNSPIINLSTWRKMPPRSKVHQKRYRLQKDTEKIQKRYRFAEAVPTVDTTNSPMFYIKPFRG